MWPKAWKKAIEDMIVGAPNVVNGAYYLDHLHKLGMLKDPPRPEEWAVCPMCRAAWPWSVAGDKARCACSFHKVIHVREVLDET